MGADGALQAASDVKRLYDWDDQDLLESLEEADLQQAIDMIEAAIQMKHHSYEARSDLMRPPPSADKPLVLQLLPSAGD